jgi:regulator of sigma E protease
MIGYNVKTNQVIIPEQYRSGKYLSPAYAAGMRDGDEVTVINGKKIYGFTDLQTAVIFSDGKPLDIAVRRGNTDIRMEILPVKSDDSGRYSIGVVPYGEKILVAGLTDGDVAQKGGIEEMDEIVSIDGVKVASPEEIINYTRDKAGRTIKLSVIRRGSGKEIALVPREQEFIMLKELNDKGVPSYNMSIHPDSLTKLIASGKLTLDGVAAAELDEVRSAALRPGKNIVTLGINGEDIKGVLSIEKRGIVGITPVTSPLDKRLEFSFGEGLAHALVEPYRFVVYNLKGMGMLFSGEMKVRENLSGPIRIVKIAGDVAYYEGIASFILLMAKISIILMVMNLLPIPVVDGSHIIFYLVEWVRGKPLNEKLMERIQSGGVIFLIMLGAFVILNDISMLPIVQKLFN